MTTAEDEGAADARMAERAIRILKRRLNVDGGPPIRTGVGGLALSEYCDANPLTGALIRFELSRSWDAHRAGMVADPSTLAARKYLAVAGDRVARLALDDAVAKLEEAELGLLSSMERLAVDGELESRFGAVADLRAGILWQIVGLKGKAQALREAVALLERSASAADELRDFPSLFGLPARARADGLTRQCLRLAEADVRHIEIAYIRGLRGARSNSGWSVSPKNLLAGGSVRSGDPTNRPSEFVG